MLFLLENLEGYILVEKKTNKGKFLNKIENLNIHAYYKYKTNKEALKSTEKLLQGKLSKNLKKFLINSVKKEDLLVVNDTKLKIEINKKLGSTFCQSLQMKRNFREIREFTNKVLKSDYEFSKNKTLSISHYIYNKKLKVAGSKIDIMIIYAIKIYDEIEKQINFYSIRLKEWYNWHFPELCNLIRDNLTYARIISKIETREQLKNIDLFDIVDSETSEKIKELSKFSLGSNFTNDDIENVICLSSQIISLYSFKEILKTYIKNRMYLIAPNLTTIIGEKIGAKLIEHVGSITNLSKCPASAIQIFGAEKALFRAKKNRKPTPKFGIIYNSTIISTTSPKNKGKIGRMISAKIALSSRIDALAEFKHGGSLGLRNRIKIEQRLKQLDSFDRKF